MEYRHFSHPHSLRIYQVHEEDHQQIQCFGCESNCIGSIYGCWDCKFFLHQHCGDASRSLQHPSHPPHHLTLLPSPTYPDGSFLCNACGDTGTAFSFCCASCDVDLHVYCALLPQQTHLRTHLHNLSLTYPHPNPAGPITATLTSIICYLCRRPVDDRYWFYSCSSCNFNVHTYCAKPKLQVAGVEHSEIGGETSRDRKEETDYISVPRARNQVGADYGPAIQPPLPGVIEDPVLRAQVELHEMQMQLQMANEMAKMMASFNLSDLV